MIEIGLLEPKLRESINEFDIHSKPLFKIITSQVNVSLVPAVE